MSLLNLVANQVAIRELGASLSYAFREPILRKELRRDRGRGYETTLADATGFDAGRQL